MPARADRRSPRRAPPPVDACPHHVEKPLGRPGWFRTLALGAHELRQRVGVARALAADPPRPLFERDILPAKALGMTKTGYKNPEGLTEPGHTTTARDLGILATRLMRSRAQKRLTAVGRLVAR